MRTVVMFSLLSPRRSYPPFHALGVTLIEMLVVLAVSALLLLAGTALTAQWVQSARVHQAQQQVVAGFEQAKALALRNPCRAQSQEPAATLVASIDEERVALTVHAGNAHSNDCDYVQADTPAHWHLVMPQGVQLTLNGAELATVSTPTSIGVAFDNRGALTQGKALSYEVQTQSSHTPSHASGNLE